MVLVYVMYVDEKIATDQWTWIEETLANSTADYLWVTGHYPGVYVVLLFSFVADMRQCGLFVHMDRRPFWWPH